MITNKTSLFDNYQSREIFELSRSLKEAGENVTINQKGLIQSSKRVIIKKILEAMANGIDVSSLFGEVVKVASTKDLVLKKLSYIYISTQAEKNSDLAILAINTFQKDLQDDNFLVRGLALRTLCSLRILDYLPYMMDSITSSLSDINPYVRKTAAMSCIKLFRFSPKHLLDTQLLKDFIKISNVMLYYFLIEGSPSEKGICLDAQKILDYIKEDEILKNTKLIIYGQSLGGSVAIDLISRNGEKKIDALILENTYLSIPKLLPEIFPTFKCLSFLCTETWRSDEKILTIQKNFPMLFLSGNKDQIVPSYHMKELFELARTTTNNVPSITSANANNDDNKIFKEFENGDHNDTFSQPGYFEVIKEFLHNKCFVIIDKQVTK
ncbi:13611_t:CDS:2 [Entrophospora sp. SA101]|nr:13611_t:CDS:2 [Entrophospora sp. SA101]